MDLGKVWQYSAELVVNFQKLRLPYWLIKDLDHVKALYFFVMVSLIVLGVASIPEIAAGSPNLQTTAEFAKMGAALIGFSMFGSFIIHGFVPNPANRNQVGQNVPNPRTPSELVRDLAILILFLGFFSLLAWQLLEVVGLFQLFDFRKWPRLDDFVRQHGLSMLEPLLQSLIATLLVTLVLYTKERRADSQSAQGEWSKSLTLRALGPYCCVLVLLCSVATAVINELI